MNQQQQQLTQQQQAQQQHHQDIVRSTAAATQQLFSYKMASSFQNPATTGTQSNPVSTSTPVGSCMRGGYDYRLGTGPGTGGGVPGTPSAPPPGVQWWYPGGVMDAGQNNLHQQLQGQQQQQHLSPITTQTSTPPVMSPVCCDHDRPPLCFLFFSLLPAFQFYILNLSPYVLHIFMYIFRLFLFARDSFMHLKEKRLIPIKSLALLFNQ